MLFLAILIVIQLQINIQVNNHNFPQSIIKFEFVLTIILFFVLIPKLFKIFNKIL